MSLDDLSLLRQYEPLLQFTEGELFFPCAIESYLEHCSLWQRSPDGETEQLAEVGTLTPDTLAALSNIPPEHTLFLRFVERPLDGAEFQRWRRTKPQFSSRGRLARVGLGVRIIDSFFDLSLLIRGRVPGGTAAAAHQNYQAIQAKDKRYVYYARVVREGGYIILHYLYFYVMNNWRSTYYGVNDHEGDWEQVFIYLSDEGIDPPQPQWVAFAAHEESGDQVRRRWDDPDLTIINETHPVVFTGAGSHASYYEPGEYLTHFRLQPLEPLRNISQAIRRFWSDTLQQGGEQQNEHLKAHVDDVFSIPFVDYARGDGLSIGVGKPAEWSPILIDDQTPWVSRYRGLWGLDTRDPLGGERAPAGPKYNRDGTVRQSWHNTLGWSGLNKVAPPRLAKAQIWQHVTRLQADLAEAKRQIEKKRETVRLLELEVRALLVTDYLDELHDQRRKHLQVEEKDLNALYEQAADLQDTIQATKHYLSRVERGDFGDPRGHLNHIHKPQPTMPQINQAMEFWAALSSGLLFLTLAISFLVMPGNWLLLVPIVIGSFALIESALRGQIARLLLNVTLFLATISAGVLLVQFFALAIVLAMLALARLLIVENWREFVGR